MKYQVEKTTVTDFNNPETNVITMLRKPTSDLKLAKATLALECMRDERLGIAAKYRIIKSN